MEVAEGQDLVRVCGLMHACLWHPALFVHKLVLTPCTLSLANSPSKTCTWSGHHLQPALVMFLSTSHSFTYIQISTRCSLNCMVLVVCVVVVILCYDLLLYIVCICVHMGEGVKIFLLHHGVLV